MKNLINWYIKHYRAEIVRADDVLRSSFNSALSDKDKAMLILIGKHQWYLKPFHPDIYNTVIDSMAIDGPWNNMKSYGCFEDIFNGQLKWKEYDYIQQLTVYDIAECIDNNYRYLNKEEAENPLKSRQNKPKMIWKSKCQ